MKHTHLLGLKDYPSEDIQSIIDTAYKFKEVLDRPIKKKFHNKEDSGKKYCLKIKHFYH